ncbi:DNA translocase FtsK 4TM domain-containing protein [Alphaproteobacteria bacterium]|nr:DNA translocase FtsK 4TM domain-containing protein [Alphaproteobacteria bacterium]
MFIFYFFSFIVISLSLASFNPLDSSFIAISSQEPNNYLGSFGAYLSSFIVHCFGSQGTLVPLFFLVASIHQFRKQGLNFIFLRFFGFLIALIFLEQFLITSNYNFLVFGENTSFGIIGIAISSIAINKYVGFVFLFLALIVFIVSLNLLVFFKKYSFLSLLKKKTMIKSNIKVKKSEPFISRKINSVSLKKNEAELNRSSSDRTYITPSLEILNMQSLKSNEKINKSGLKDDASFIEGIFTDFNITIEVVNIRVGPVITLYEVLPAAGIKINSIINLAGDISRSMGATSVRIAQVYGTKFIGIEIPNKHREMVTIRELLSSEEFIKSEHKIPICIGKNITGETEVVDLSKTPHLLVAGTTGSGKSVFINSLLASMLFKFPPSKLRLILIDPKMLELSVYNDIPHLLTPVVTEPRKSIMALKWVCGEMERRYTVMNEAGCRNLENFNLEADDKMPFIVVVIDEMADLMMTAGKEVEHYVQRLAQMARACGIHLVMATQRPSVDIITGSIKANFPSRISFQVASKYDSRTILGEVGAEQLLGNGDMLMMKNGSNIIRYQSAFMSDKEVLKMIKEIKSNYAAQYVEEIERVINNENDENVGNQLSSADEELITKSIDLIKNSGRASTSYLQRNFQIGYNKAARIMEVLEDRGVVSQPNHAGKREILISN